MLNTVRLVILHYHFRPGGVRRVIELATPHLVKNIQPKVTEVVIVCDEVPNPDWLEPFRRLVDPCKVLVKVLPALGYIAEQKQSVDQIEKRLKRFLSMLIGADAGDECIVWAHNQSLGRNLLATRELVKASATHHRILMLHHHDWWFDNRWQRWSEMRRCGARTIAGVAQTLLHDASYIRHITINHADALVLKRYLPQRVAWIPNLAEPGKAPAASRIWKAREWLADRVRESSPIWLVPTRLLRRKNLAEALLITRWLRPEAWLVTTAGVSSDNEHSYATRLQQACKTHRWRLRLGILQKESKEAPSVVELMAASEVIMLSSLQEGFGLPYLEAASANRPLIARSLPNIAPDLKRFGFRFPQAYEEIWIDSRLFDGDAEKTRCEVLFGRWRKTIPANLRSLAPLPDWYENRNGQKIIPFSRLSLDAQLEVLNHPVEDSWKLCLPLNPFLARWRSLAGRHSLKTSPWPREAAGWLGGDAYAGNWIKLMERLPVDRVAAGASAAAQLEFIRSKLAAQNQYPLLWSTDG